MLSCLLGEKVSLEERLESVQFQCCPAAMLLSQSCLSSGSRASWCRLVESQLNVPVRRVWWGCCFVLVLCKVSQVPSICPRYSVGCSVVLSSYPQVWPHLIVSL